MDIASYTYLSNGKILNGTIWLLEPLYSKDHASYVKNNLSFEFRIIAGNNIEFPTYGLIISPEADGTWTKTLLEYEPFLGTYSPLNHFPNFTRKIIDKTNNYTGFFEDGLKYVDFSIDLGKISYPNSYWYNLLVPP